MAGSTMGIALAIAFYASGAVFLWRVVWRFILWARAAGGSPGTGEGKRGLPSAVLDIVFLGRLFRVNAGLWWGEWFFHVSFVFVVIRHLVYFFNPVPGWVAALQSPGVVAGYVLPASLLYFFVWRFAVERMKYVSFYNLFLTLTLLAVSVSGLLLRHTMRVDLVEVKEFMISALVFRPVAEFPGNWLFLVHFVLVLVVVPALPTHIFSAPVTILEARRREEERPLHEG